jgi:hypothetical protein
MTMILDVTDLKAEVSDWEQREVKAFLARQKEK